MTVFAKSINDLRSSEIRDLMKLANQSGMILFSGGMPDNDLFPLDEMDHIYNQLTAGEKKIAMQYGPTNGLPVLLESLNTFLRKKGLPVDSNKILITTGSLQAINILAKAFTDPGDTIITENPCFIGAISAFKSYQANIVSVPLKPDGIDVEELSMVLKKPGPKPKFVYLTPNFHNPAGTLYSADRKAEIIALLNGLDIPLIEDDVYSDLFFHNEDKPHLRTFKEINPEGIDICYTGSFSKILGPGLRLGWMLVPEHIYQRCELIKQSFDACSASFSQIRAHKFLETGAVYPYIERVRKEYARRAEAMTDEIHKHLKNTVQFTIPRGGFYIWLQLPENLDATAILEKAITKGIVFVSGKTFDPQGVINNYIRLSYCNTSAEKISKGIPLLAEAIKSFL